MANSSFNQNFVLGNNYFYIVRTNSVGGNSTSYVGKWNGGADTIEAVSGGVNGLSNSVITGPVENSIFVGGLFSQAGGSVTANNIAYFNGTSWEGMETSPFNSDVTALAYDPVNNKLYAGSHGTSTIANRLCVWDGDTWTALASSFTISNYPKLALDSDGNLYLGFGSVLRRFIFATSTWEVLSASIGGTIIDIKYNAINDRIYIALNTTGTNIKYYDVANESFTSLASVAGSVYAIAFDADNNLYASCSPSSGYLSSVVKYNDGAWTNLYNYQNTFGVLELEIDLNGVIFAKPNSGAFLIGLPPYTNGNWSEFSASTTISYSGPAEPTNEGAGLNIQSTTGTASGIATATGVGTTASIFIWGIPTKIYPRIFNKKVLIAGQINREKTHLLNISHLWEIR